jgi:hypothetical protein
MISGSISGTIHFVRIGEVAFSDNLSDSLSIPKEFIGFADKHSAAVPSLTLRLMGNHAEPVPVMGTLEVLNVDT